MTDEQFKLLYNKIEKLEERVYEYNKIVNNDIKHIVADISAFKVLQEGIVSKVDKICLDKDSLREGLNASDSKVTVITSNSKLLLQIVLPIITLLLGMLVKSLF